MVKRNDVIILDHVSFLTMSANFCVPMLSKTYDRCILLVVDGMKHRLPQATCEKLLLSLN